MKILIVHLMESRFDEISSEGYKDDNINGLINIISFGSYEGSANRKLYGPLNIYFLMVLSVM